MAAISKELPSQQVVIDVPRPFLDVRLTRRTLLSSAASAAVIFCLTSSEEEQGKRNFGMDWSPVSYANLAFSPESPVPIVGEESITDQNKLMDYSITVPDHTPVQLSLRQTYNTTNEPSEHIFRVHVSGQPIDRIVTKIFAHGEDELPTKIHLGSLSGTHRVEAWKHDQNDQSITALHLEPEFSSRSEETILDRFEAWSPYHTGSIDSYDDFFVAAYGDIQENDDYYLLSYYGLRTDEDGGMSDWSRFLTYGNFRDSDDTIQILVDKPSLKPEKVQYQGANHVFRSHSGLLLDRSHPYFRYVTANHMGTASRPVSIKRILGLLPSHRERFITHVPILTPSGVDGSEWIIAQHPSIATLSRREADPGGIKYIYPPQ